MLGSLKELIQSGDPDRQSLRSLLAGGTLGTAAVQIVLAGLGFLAALVLASLIGASGYGAYAWALAWATILRVPSILGRDRLLVRQVAAYYARGEWGLLRGVISHSSRVVLSASLVVVAVGSVVVWILNSHIDSPLLQALQVGLVLVPFMALVSTRSASLQGLHRIIAAQLPDGVIRPLVFLILLAIASVTIGSDLSARSALAFQAFASACGLGVAAVILGRTLRVRAVEAAPATDASAWNRSALAFAATTALAVILERFDVILIGVVKGAADAGVYAADVRAAVLIGLAVVAVNVAFGPIISRLYALDDIGRLRRAVTLTTRIAFAITLLIAGAVSLAATPLLSLFGERFTDGATALRLLSVSVVINAAGTSDNMILMMTKHERISAATAGISVVLNVGLNLILIPAWGINGAAATMVVTMLVRNGIAAGLTWALLGIDSTILGLVPRSARGESLS